MNDYEIQKATASKVGVVSPPDNIYECRKAILEKLGGDSTDADTIYECDKRILPLIGGGSANLQEKSVNITENGTTSVLPDEGYSLSKVDVNVKVPLKLPNGTKLGGSKFTVCPDYDFSDITDMSEMFKDCLNLTSINQIDTSNVTDMSYMFLFCESLESIPMLDTSNVTNVVDMFLMCQNVTDLGGFTNLGKAFTSAQTLDLSESNRVKNTIQNIIDTVFDMNLNTTGGSATLKLSQSVINSMTDEQKSQLAAKGWTLTN